MNRVTQPRLKWLAILWPLCLTPVLAVAQGISEFQLPGANLQKSANAVISLMSFAVVPDLASSSLAINNGATGNPNVTLWQLGGGFTWSKTLPLYLEGSIGYNRYDPTYVASNGVDSRLIPTKWNTVAGTMGVGWDFPLTANKELVFRPIFNVSLARVTTDASVAQFLLGQKTGKDINFIENGHLNAYGLGGSVMLDWERHAPTYDADVELRYTNIHLQSFGGTSSAVTGTGSAQTASLYARYRAPTGMWALDRPVRYVLELSHSRYLGRDASTLGFNDLTTLGTGLELDTSAHEVFVTRIRAVVRYVFGNNVSGISLGIAASF